MNAKRILTVALLAVIGTGCGQNSPGGPGAKTSDNKDNTPIVGTAEQAFMLSGPTLSTSIKQGESKVITIGIKRGKNFSQDVSLKFLGLPTGVSVDPSSPAIKHGEEEVKLTLKAAADAAVGDFTAKIVGHPATGADATSDFKFSVAK